MILDKHWWWTNDKAAVVPDGHPDAAFLAFARGHELADALARKYGILEDPEPEAKAKPAPANKAKAQPSNKSE